MACRSRIQTERESDVYAGVGVTGLPDVGPSLTFGQVLFTKNPRNDFAFELRGTYQGGDDSATQDGRFFHLQAGMKQMTSPGHDRRWVFRYGATWFRATGDPRIVDKPGDYLGAYGAVAYEWRLGRRFWASPEFTLNVVNGEGSTGGAVVPQAGCHVYFDC